MPEPFQHLQLAELIERVLADRRQQFPVGVAIVHPADDLSLGIPDITVGSRDETYTVSTGSRWSKHQLTQVEALGLTVGPEREMLVRFGPQKGQLKRLPGALGARFDEVEPAAIAALTCAHILWGVRPDEWLWITTTSYDHREEMRRPADWPPVG